MKPTRFFLLKGNENMIDHVKSIRELGCIYWKKSRNRNLKVGDICYLYLKGEGHFQVRYRLEVVDTSSARNDRSCWQTYFIADNDCYKLAPTSEMYIGDKLSLDTLEEIGISRYVLFKELNKAQEDYLKEFFRKKGNGPLFLSIFRK